MFNPEFVLFTTIVLNAVFACFLTILVYQNIEWDKFLNDH